VTEFPSVGDWEGNPRLPIVPSQYYIDIAVCVDDTVTNMMTVWDDCR